MRLTESRKVVVYIVYMHMFYTYIVLYKQYKDWV